MFRHSVVCLLVMCSAGPAFAQAGANGIFDEAGRDFGAVPRGPTLTHSFHLVNNTGYPLHVAGVRVSCGCTSAHVLVDYLAPGQDTFVLAQMDTRRFIGPKTVTIFVTLDQPRYEEVRLFVTANSREDVTIMPESLAMGRIRRATAPTASTTIAFFGDSNWQITGVTSDSNYIQPVCKMVRREGYEVAYQLSARLRPDTPAGKWYSDVWLITNNPATPRVRVPLTVEIESALTINPGTVVLGQVKAGAEVERKVIVRGAEPFLIKSIKGTDKEIAVRDTTSDAKTVHVLTVTVHGNRPGDVNRTFRVITDLKGDNDIEFTAQAQVVP